MRCLRLEAADRLVLAELPDPSPGPGEAVVALRAASLNHRDVWIKKGQYAGTRFPCIPGSDGAGTVESVGLGVDPSWTGKDVIINPSFGWGPSESAQGPQFSILGLPRDGTLSTKIAVPQAQFSLKPAHLSWEEAAALPLAGLTAWRALFSRARLKPSDRVLITGIGGGVALFALRLATQVGAETWVTSGSAEKISWAERIGAKGGFLYHQPGWAGEAAKSVKPFDVMVDGAGGEGFSDLVDLASPGARIVLYGATRGNTPSLPLRKIFWRQLSVMGTTMGSPADWTALVAFVETHRLRPVVSDVFSFEKASEAFALMERGGQFGKIVIRTA